MYYISNLLLYEAIVILNSLLNLFARPENETRTGVAEPITRHPLLTPGEMELALPFHQSTRLCF